MKNGAIFVRKYTQFELVTKISNPLHFYKPRMSRIIAKQYFKDTSWATRA